MPGKQFVQIGHYTINLNAIAYTLDDGEDLVISFCAPESPGNGVVYPARLTLHGANADTMKGWLKAQTI